MLSLPEVRRGRLVQVSERWEWLFAFGLSVVAMAYAIGGISGCHINPAITLGVLLSGRMSGKDAAMYMVFQVIGAVIGSAILYALVLRALMVVLRLPVPMGLLTE